MSATSLLALVETAWRWCSAAAAVILWPETGKPGALRPGNWRNFWHLLLGRNNSSSKKPLQNICLIFPYYWLSFFLSGLYKVSPNFSSFFFFLFFDVGHSLKVFIEFVTVLLLFYVLVFWPRGMWDLSSLTRDWTCPPCIGRRSLNCWTPKEVPLVSLFYLFPWNECFYYIIHWYFSMTSCSASALLSDEALHGYSFVAMKLFQIWGKNYFIRKNIYIY